MQDDYNVLSHRHIRYALFFHNLAMIACIRKGLVAGEERNKYLNQINLNQRYIRKYVANIRRARLTSFL